ncbi:MAG: tyrosine-type recombinase/integrase [Leptospirales bacterium]
MKNIIDLTKSTIDKLPLSDGKQVIYWDKALKGFGLRIGSTSKVFIVRDSVNGKKVQVTIGAFGAKTPDEARREARVQLGNMASGVNPIAKKREIRAKSVTLSQAFDDYLVSRKDLKPGTVSGYRHSINVHFAEWKDRPLSTITKTLIEKKHKEIGESPSGRAQANLSMRLLRAIFNFSMGKYEDGSGRPVLADNPVKRLSHTKAWYRVDRRQGYISPDALPKWFDAVMKLESEVIRDYLIFILFTGLRRQEAAGLRWQDVSLQNRTFTVRDTKNHEDHTLPLTDYLMEMILRRRQETDSLFVFPGEGRTGRIVEPKRQIQQVIKASGVSFMLHDLRRTFASYAAMIVPAYTLKKLMNHKNASDVTLGYVISGVEDLRKPMQDVSDFILLKSGQSHKAVSHG